MFQEEFAIILRKFLMLNNIDITKHLKLHNYGGKDKISFKQYELLYVYLLPNTY
jgi:hypothetical protein